MDLGLAGRRALVLGAGGGLGAAIVRALQAEGTTVVAADVSRAALDRLTTESTDSLAVDTVVLDLCHPETAAQLVGESIARDGDIDVLVNITGGPPPSAVHGVPLDTWRSQFDAMVTSVFAITDRVLPGMLERGWGRIITSTSSGVITPIPDLGVSNTLRSSLVGWSKTLATEVGPRGVTSNVVVPGRIATPRILFLDEQRAQRSGITVEEVREASQRSIPLTRYGAPEEFADAVAFLASERASYITGSVIRVDGGLIPSAQ